MRALGESDREPRYAGGVPTGRDDDALTWGDDDPTLDVGAPAGEDAAPSDPPPALDPAALPDGYTAVGKGSESVAEAAEPQTQDDAAAAGEDEDQPAMGNAELISLGVLGGFSLLYAVGWIIGGLRLQGTAEFLVAPLAYQVSLWLAVAAPLVWFGTVLLLTRESRRWVRFTWLIAGVVLLLPWPFIMVGAIGR